MPRRCAVLHCQMVHRLAGTVSQHMEVHPGLRRTSVSHQRGDHGQVHSVIHQVRGVAVTQALGRYQPLQVGLLRRLRTTSHTALAWTRRPLGERNSGPRVPRRSTR